MGSLAIYRLPTEREDLLEQFATRMKPLRLKGLQTDSGCFISRYESESVEPAEFWLDRLRAPSAHHLVLIRHDGDPGEDEVYALLHYDWVGFNVLIEVGKVDASSTKREASDIAEKPADWFMAALYIDPSCRGQGAGKKMVAAGLQLIKDEIQKSGKSNILCVTYAIHGNHRALELYKKMRFQVTSLDAIEMKEGKEYHSTELKLQITVNND